MATTNLSFAAQIDDWVRSVDERMLRVFRESAEELKTDMQTPVGAGGNMPIDTGTLRRSLVASLDGMPVIDPSNTARPGPSSEAPEVSLVIAGAELGQTIHLGYTAAHAPFVEFGTSKMAPRAFVRLAAAKWQQIVERVTVRAKAAAGR